MVEEPRGEHHDMLNDADVGHLVFHCIFLQQSGWLFRNLKKIKQTKTNYADFYLETNVFQLLESKASF